MKFFAVFAAVLALAAAAPTTQWTLHDLSTALQNPATPAAMVPYLEAALNTMMESMFSGTPVESIAVPTPAGLLPVVPSPVIVAEPATQWTLHDLSTALQNPATPAELVPYLEDALNSLMESMFTGKPVESIAVPTPAGLLPVAPSPVIVAEPATQWTLQDLSNALQNPATPAELVPYLEDALNSLMESMFSGKPVESIAVPTPAGLLPVDAISPVEVAPVAVGQPEPVAVAQPEPVIVAPTPVAVAEASGSPLVQIIVNIKSQEVAPETIVAPETPVPEVPGAVVIAPEVPESVVIAPSPIVIVPEVPEAVVIVPEAPAINPIDVIAVGAPDVNPVDLLQPVPVAVAAPEVNPIDLLQPMPVVVAGESNGPLV